MQGDTLAPFLFIICLDYALRTSVDIVKDLGFTWKPRQCRRSPAETDVDYADDLALLADTIEHATTLLQKLEKEAKEVGLLINARKTEFISYNQSGKITSLNGQEIKSVDEFTYLGSNIASTKRDVQLRIGKAWGDMDGLRTIWKSTLSDNLKREFHRAAVQTVVLYDSSTWTLTKQLESRLDNSNIRIFELAP